MGKELHIGNIGTFVIHVEDYGDETWKGAIEWLEEDLEAPFVDVRELVLNIEQALELSRQNRAYNGRVDRPLKWRWRYPENY